MTSFFPRLVLLLFVLASLLAMSGCTNQQHATKGQPEDHYSVRTLEEESCDRIYTMSRSMEKTSHLQDELARLSYLAPNYSDHELEQLAQCYTDVAANRYFQVRLRVSADFGFPALAKTWGAKNFYQSVKKEVVYVDLPISALRRLSDLPAGVVFVGLPAPGHFFHERPGLED